eukprot:6980599-Pyramimonas_sp.AAC.1
MASAAIEPRTAGKGRALTLMCHGKHDPMYRATMMPVVTLVRSLWEVWVPLRILEVSVPGCLGIRRCQ